MVKIDNKPMFNKMHPRKMEKIQIYPSKQHCGYNKMTNQLPKLTKTIMSPLTTMPPKKMMIAPQNGVAIKANPTSPQTAPAMKAEAAVAAINSLQMSAMKNNFAAKVNTDATKTNTEPTKINTELSSTPKVPPIVIAPAKIEEKIVEKVKDKTAAGYRSEQISLDDIHPYITCFLCRGYLIEATTIVECLHTYCHSCLMKHLAKEKCCPQCDMSINKSKTNIKYDATIQSIVYKLVPGLYQKELLRRRAFYKQRPEEAKLATPEERGDDTEHLILSPLDLISLSLDYAEKETLQGMESDESIQKLLKPKYLNCPAVFKVEHLKKFIVSKFAINSSRFNVEISYKVKTIVLPEHYTLMDVAYIYTWKKEAPMPFFFRIIAKNSKCDELPEVSLRRSPTTTLPNAAEDSLTKKKSVSFKEEVQSIERTNKVANKPSSDRKSIDNPPNPPRIETIKLKLDVSNNNVSIIKNTSASTPEIKHKEKKKEKKHKHEHSLPKYSIDNEKSQPRDDKKDEYEFDDDIDQQKLGFLNTFQLTAKKILDAKLNMKNDSSAKTECTSTSATNNKNNLSHKPTEHNVNKRKSKEPVKTAPKKYKFHEMKSVGEGNKFLFTKTGDGHEITFDMSPKPLGSKPSLSKVKSDIMMAQQRADAKANKEKEQAKLQEANKEDKSKNLPFKPKKLPMLLPKQPNLPVKTPAIPASSVSPTAFVIKKPETNKDFASNEISVTKINDQNHQLRVYGPKTPVKESSPPQNKSSDGFAQPLPPKKPPTPTHPNILKPYGYPIKMPKNIPENMQTPYGCRTPFYVPSSPSYTPNFDPKPQFKYANPNAYASFMQSMFCAPSAGKISPPVNTSTPKNAEGPKKRPSTENAANAVPTKRKSPSPTKPVEGDSKAISILNKINFPSSLSVTLTNEQEENKKEQLRSQKQSVVNNNIEIIKISEEKDLKAKAASATPDKKPASDKKTAEPKKLSPILPALVPNPSALLNPAQMLSPPVAKALNESKESFQRAFLESLMSVANKQNLEKNSKKDSPKSEAGKAPEVKTEDTPKNLSKSEGKKNVSLTPPPSKSTDKVAVNSSKSLTPPPLSHDPMFATNAAQAMQLNLMFNAINAAAAAKPPFPYTEYANIQRAMLVETLRQNVEKSSALLAMHHQIQQQQQSQKNPSASHSPSSSASSPSSKH